MTTYVLGIDTLRKPASSPQDLAKSSGVCKISRAFRAEDESIQTVSAELSACATELLAQVLAVPELCVLVYCLK